MTPRTTLLLPLVVFVAALGTAWHFVLRAEELRLRLSTTESQVRKLRSEIAELRRTARIEKSETITTSVPDRTTNSPPVDLSPEAVRKMSETISEDRKQALLESPPLQVLFEESRRGMYRVQFAALFKRLKLSPKQQAALISAFVAWDMTASDLNAVMKQQGMSRDDPALKARRAEAEAALRHDVQAVLGPDAFTITREYTRLNAARSYVAGYGGLLSRLGSPLTFDQLEGLVNIFGEVSPNTSPQPSRLSASQWDQIEARAHDILAPDQWEIFRSTTPPGQSDGRWASAATEELEEVAQASGPNKGQ